MLLKLRWSHHLFVKEKIHCSVELFYTAKQFQNKMWFINKIQFSFLKHIPWPNRRSSPTMTDFQTDIFAFVNLLDCVWKFNSDPSYRRAPTASHIIMSMGKISGTFTAGTKGTRNSPSHFTTLLILNNCNWVKHPLAAFRDSLFVL